MSDDDEKLTPRAVSDEYEIPEPTLAQWRHLNKGPKYLKLGGHVRYKRSWLNEWEESAARGVSDA